jgi:N-acetylglucosaminyl-diphospho-decaprenol L-rhamnosyltransferase
MSITQAKVAIITVTFNSSGFIDNYLDALSSFLIGSSHILIVVDNASVDDTVVRIENHRQAQTLEKNIRIITLPKNVGFGGGCNIGIAAAGDVNASHLWFLNPDTEVLSDSADKLLALFSARPSTDFVGSVLIDQQQQERAGAFRFPSIINVCLSTLKLGILDRLLKQHTTAIPIATHPYPADWLTGASFMARSQTIDALNGFDPHYFLYFEEVDLFYRAKNKGFTVLCCPESRVFHISGASTGINNQHNDTHNITTKRQPGYWFESRRHFYVSNYGRLYFSLVDFCQICCLLCWKLRAKLQKKSDTTPDQFTRDIIRYSYPAQLLKRLFGTS